MEPINGHDHCLLCGALHPRSWKLTFTPDMNGEVSTKFVAGKELQGYDNLVHGGVICSLLDAAMTHCLFHQSIQAVTGDLRVRFLHPVACDIPLELRARLIFACPPLYQLQAELRCDGQLMARAEGKFMRRGCHDTIDRAPANHNHHSC
ncbi:MAG: PaaI family thioesterase [Clostridia bacterium]|nr:PaaI family thioesterase [Clostridia bacterium]